MSTYAKNCPFALRACILYDSEMGKNEDESYRDLMMTFGREFMKREEFDYWRSWFGSGNKELDDKRRKRQSEIGEEYFDVKRPALQLAPELVEQLAAQLAPYLAPQLVPPIAKQPVAMTGPQEEPQLAPKVAPQLTPKLAPQPTPVPVPQEEPQLVPQLPPTPVARPVATRRPTPGPVPQLATQLTPRLASPVRQRAPQMAPQLSPKLAPQLAPQPEPKPVTQLAPQPRPQKAPKLAPQMEPNLASQLAPQLPPTPRARRIDTRRPTPALGSAKPRWAELPDKWCRRLFGMLELKDMIQFSKVCKPWKKIMEETGFNCEELKLEVEENHIAMSIDNKRIRYDLLDGNMKTRMIDVKDLRYVNIKDPVKMMLNDFKFFLLNKAHSFELVEITIERNHLKMPDRLLDAISHIPVNSFHIDRLSIKGPYELLQGIALRCKGGILRSLEFFPKAEPEMSRILHQSSIWNRITHLECNFTNLEPLCFYERFKKIIIKMERGITLRDIDNLSKIVHRLREYEKIVFDFRYGLVLHRDFWRLLDINQIPCEEKCYEINKILRTGRILNVSSIPNNDRQYLAFKLYRAKQYYKEFGEEELNLNWVECEWPKEDC